jgi:serine/threonine protein kinase
MDCATGSPSNPRALDRESTTKIAMALELGPTDGVSPASGADRLTSFPCPPGFELADEIGRGGMRVVFRAVDAALDRDVAIKLLADRYPADSPVAQRFVGEARITAQLTHPGIPPVHQVGALPDGRPYLIMKLIKGSTLEAIVQNRNDPMADRGRLLAVFEGVCQAVGYAHAHRVIHRDLKPANIMVGAFGEVQVMDWGLAKLLGKEPLAQHHPAPPEQTLAWTEISPTPISGSQTQAGSLVGTPAYISPEQAGGEIERVDERADVFGLGAVLVVILTGQPPYVGDSADAVRGKLDECFERLDRCGADLELIALCKRCLADNPGGRPPDGGAVAAAIAELRSKADERARSAERDRAASDAREEEQQRKRRWQFAAAGVVMLALAAGIIGLVAHQHAQAKANADLAATNSELVAANERERQRFGLAVDAIGRDLLLQQKEFEGLRNRLLTGAADFYGKLESQLKDRSDPASRVALGRAYFELGDLTDAIGSKESAIAIHRKALAIRKALAAENPTNLELQLDVARSLGRLGWLLDLAVGDAVPMFEEQQNIVQNLFRETPTDEVRIALAQVLFGIGVARSRFEFSNEGGASLEKGLEIQRALADGHPTVMQYQSDLAKMYRYQAEQLTFSGKTVAAATATTSARDIQQKLADAHPTDTSFQLELAVNHFQTAWQMYILGRSAQGLISARAGRAILQRLVDDHPAVTEFQLRLAQTDDEISELLTTKGEYAEGLAAAQLAYAVFQKLVDHHPTVVRFRLELVYSRASVADGLRLLNRRQEARTICQAAIDEAERLERDQPEYKVNHSVMAWTIRLLGQTLLEDGEFSAAVPNFRRSAELYEGLPKKSGELWFEIACCHAGLSVLAGRDGSGIPSSERQREADLALTNLKKAVEFGYQSERFQRDKSLDPVRDREDFRKLLAEIESRIPSAGVK